MKIKRLKVGVRPLEEGLEEFGATLKALQAGKAVPKRTGVYIVSVEAMRQVLTPSRLTLLHLIRSRRPPFPLPPWPNWPSGTSRTCTPI
jgi:predicted transcriptional regulator